jgi:hypothetical protein
MRDISRYQGKEVKVKVKSILRSEQTLATLSIEQPPEYLQELGAARKRQAGPMY